MCTTPNANEAYSNFIQKLTFAIVKVAPCNTKKVKVSSKEYFGRFLSEGINKS